MATNKKISTQVSEQLPAFLQEEGPNLVAFMKAYYEWTETANNVIEVSKNIPNYQDIDTSIDRYMEYFRREIASSIPDNIVTNKKFLFKHIKDLYRARGSRKSYNLLFRLLFNEDIEYFNPGDNILRASDGRWVKENSIRVSSPASGNTFALGGLSITGLTSGATAKVERINQTEESGFLVNELFLSNITGTFQDLELVKNEANTINATIYNISGPITGISVLDGGAGHVQGDRVSIAGAGSTLPAKGTITQVDNLSAINVNITNGGSGFRVTTKGVGESANTRSGTIITTTGGSGSGAVFQVKAINNTETLSMNDDDIFPMRNVRLDAGVKFVTTGANTSAVSANLASANISSQILQSLNFANQTVGTISQISIVNHGRNFNTELPTITALDEEVAELRIGTSLGFKGQNATLAAVHQPGAIETIEIDTARRADDSGGAGFNKYQLATITNTTRVANNTVTETLGSPGVKKGYSSTGFPQPFGVFEYEGKYIDFKGFLSSDMRLQDNFYYQEYSYVLKSDNFLRKYRSFVNSILHPAGNKLFGTVRIRPSLDLTPTLSTFVGVSGNVASKFTTTDYMFDSTSARFDRI